MGGCFDYRGVYSTLALSHTRSLYWLVQCQQSIISIHPLECLPFFSKCIDPLLLYQLRSLLLPWIPIRLRQRHCDLHIGLREVPSASVNRAFVPIFIHFVCQLDHVVFLEENVRINIHPIECRSGYPPWSLIRRDSQDQSRTGQCNMDRLASAPPQASSLAISSAMARGMLLENRQRITEVSLLLFHW